MLQSGLYLKRIKGAAMAKVKISDVAREAGVSLGTVSNALNHPEKLRPETLKLINETINRLGYLQPKCPSARRRHHQVLWPGPPPSRSRFSLQIASGAHNEARKHGYDLLIANADNDGILQDHYLRYFMGTQMSGVMVQPMASPDWHPAMTKMPVPIVHLDIHCSEPGYYVAADNEAQGRIIAELAVARGARHITVVGRAAFMQLTLRVLGIHKALALHPDIKIEVIDAGEWNTAADGYSIGAQIAERSGDERPDFVIGLTDVLASGVISALIDKGISVPEQVRVAGCDATRSPGAGRSHSPRWHPQATRLAARHSIAHGANRKQSPGEDQARPYRFRRTHRHRGHGRRGHQPPRARTPVFTGARQHPGKQSHRSHRHQPRRLPLAHGLDRGRQIEQRIEHSLAAIHHVLRQRHDVGNGKDMTAGRDARDATVA